MRQAGTHVRRGKRDNDKQNNGKLFPLKKARSEQIKKSSPKAVPEATRSSLRAVESFEFVLVFARKRGFDVTVQLEDENITVSNLCNSATKTTENFFRSRLYDSWCNKCSHCDQQSLTFLCIVVKKYFLSLCGRKFFVRSRTFNEYFNVRKGDPTSGDQKNSRARCKNGWGRTQKEGEGKKKYFSYGNEGRSYNLWNCYFFNCSEERKTQKTLKRP